MAQKTYHGRLVTYGGHLRADQHEQVGLKTVYLHDEAGEPILDGDGNETYVNLPIFKDGPDNGKPVAWDPETDGYIFIEEDAPSHNDRHHRQFADVSLTSGTLYDEAGRVVYQGDPHHDSPVPEDPHFLDGSVPGYAEQGGSVKQGRPTNTRLLFDDDAPDKHKKRKVPTTQTMNLPVDQHEHEIESGDPTVTGHTDAEAYRA